MSEDHAELARSILACPDAADIAVDGFPTLGDDEELGLREEDGTPKFSCRTWSPMAHAGRAGSHALLTLTSGLGPLDGRDRQVSLTLTGRLANGALESCHCCGEQRQEVTMELDLVVLARGQERVQVPLPVFQAPELRLNRGYLQRTVEHANDCHREDLGQVVSRLTGTSTSRLLDVTLADLTTHGAELSWIDVDGGHRTSLWFSRQARTVDELGLLLRHELHAGIC